MPNRRPVDIHAHFYPAELIAVWRAEGPRCGGEVTDVPDKGPVLKAGSAVAGPLGPRFTDLDARLAAMDEQGVAVQALSLSLPMVFWADEPLARTLSEAYNDAAAAAHRRHPERLVSLAMLPMHHPRSAIAELERARRLPGVRGVYMATAIAGRELSDPLFFPVYEAIEAAGLPLFLHPVTVIGHERLTAHYLQNLLGNPFETAIAAAHLIFGGVLDRFPRLTVCLPHAGGAFPYLVGRLNRGWEKRPELAGRERGPLEYLRRFYYDTISYHAPALDYLVRLVGADRVMMGSDYCFPIAIERPVEVVTGHPGFTADEQALVVEGNARRLLALDLPRALTEDRSP
jgi:aminocarboxymuconate-semialdehyde decarboxylase